ncbi:MAG: hypothetical protein LBM71_00205 [Elusimicrobiota bacterium]|jgi:hypothetical protein|nr:hypothetical protein [Elusimicrobiota bacterium]
MKKLIIFLLFPFLINFLNAQNNSDNTAVAEHVEEVRQADVNAAHKAIDALMAQENKTGEQNTATQNAQAQAYGNAPYTIDSTVHPSTLDLVRPNADTVSTLSGRDMKIEQPEPPLNAKPYPPKEQQKTFIKSNPQAQTEPKSNVNWINSSSGNFNIKIERRTANGITTPNLAMKFENIYQILRQNIPWMMGGKASVYVYQNRASFLRNEPVADSWAGAFFSASENRIVMYDEPNNTQKMIQQFTHELTHLFVENFFNPPNEPFKLEPPVWLNEGLAVNMEDISIDSKGGVWADDLVAVNFLSSAVKKQFSGNNKTSDGRPALNYSRPRQPLTSKGYIISSKTVIFVNFADFVHNDSYDIAEVQNNVENWYLQAYAMVRFLFKPENATYPKKRMQFEQFTKLLKTFVAKKGPDGKPMKDAKGKTIMVRYPVEQALKKAYGFRDMADFEQQFWKWLKAMQQTEREKILNGQAR